MKNKRLYVAYGSNLHNEQMAYRCPDAKVVCNGVIENYALVFRGSKTGAYATIIPEKGEEVPVTVWEISPRDEWRLDQYEGFPTFYQKEDIVVRDSKTGRNITAMVYIMCKTAKVGQPSRTYLTTCGQGYRDQGLNITKLSEAVTRNCREVLEAALKGS